MKVLLVNPPNNNSLLLPMDKKKIQHSGHKPPLGILYIGSYIKRHVNVELKLLDAQLEGMNYERAVEYTIEYNPQLIGVTTWTDYWYDICQYIDNVKKVLPKSHVCLGGPHTTIYPKETLNRKSVDSIVLGDGEKPFLLLIHHLKDKKEINFKGLYFSNKINEYKVFDSYIEKNLESINIPDRTLLPYKKYDSLLSNNLMTTMITSRGCPYRCTFCKLNFQKTVLRSPENIILELKEINSLGIKEIEIYDDTFGLDKNRIINICEMMEKEKLKFEITIRDRANNINEETIIALKKVGLKRIYLGVESYSNNTLKKVKKQINSNQVINAVNIAKKYNIEILTYFMIGLPGEKKEDFYNSLEFAKSLKPDYTNFSITIPYPGTELYEEALKKGIIKKDIWKEFVTNPTSNMIMPVYEEIYTRDQLLKFHKDILHKFYFRINYILSRFKKIKSFTQFYKMFREAMSLWIK